MDNIQENATKLAATLAADGIAVAPTDTLYGILGCFNSSTAYNKIYKAKGRDADKRLIALVNSFEMAQELSAIKLPPFLKEQWPGPITIVVPTKADHPYGWDTQAIRYPDDQFLQTTIDKLAEPIFAPSANPQGEPPCRNIEEAQKYFGTEVDLYIDGGTIESGLGSTIIAITKDSQIKLLRQGAVKLPDNLF